MLALVRFVHTLIYAINGAACFALLYAGLTGHDGLWLWIAAVLIVVEAAILLFNGLRCPMSPLAERYGARETGFLYDTFIPERLTRHTVPFFSVVVVLGLLFAGLRWLGVIT